MSRTYLLPETGNFYKANLHSHSTFSDGHLTPQQMKELYQAHGYSILAFTDHNRYHDANDLTDEHFLALNGVELDTTRVVRAGTNEYEQTCHINGICRTPDIVPKDREVIKAKEYSTESITREIQALHDINFLVNYNHPAWSSETPDEFLGYKGYDGFEIYNYGSDVYANNGYSQSEFLTALRSGVRTRVVATDDNHNVPEFYRSDSCGGWVTFKAPELTYESIIAAYDASAFYASWGPEIYSYYREGSKLVIDCSPVERAMIWNQDIDPRELKHDGVGKTTHFEFDLTRYVDKSRFLVIQLVDLNGKMAWTNPYYPQDEENA